MAALSPVFFLDWCAEEPQGGGAAQFTLPGGVGYTTAQLPHTPYNIPIIHSLARSLVVPNITHSLTHSLIYMLCPSRYKNATGAVFWSWRPGHWANWAFEIGKDVNSQFHFAKGGVSHLLFVLPLQRCHFPKLPLITFAV